ncbi:MAG: MerR family transcriptional regulator [Oscillospiraceae bacterium]
MAKTKHPYQGRKAVSGMKLSISEAAARMGVSVRTLRYYDAIGLLRPSEVADSGYRYYDEQALWRLQQILFFRELEFPLKEVAELLSRPEQDKRPALRRQRELLLRKRQRLDGLLRQIDEYLEEISMKKPNITAEEMRQARRQYADEVRQRWGDTAAYAESEEKRLGRSEAQELGAAEEAEEIFAAFAALMDREPEDAEVQALVARWQTHITENYYRCTKEILACLGQMYTADERFTEHLDRHGDGCAAFIGEAIAVYCAK